MNFVIIGGDAAGMSAASRAKRQRPDLNVIVLEKTPDVSYSACGMPYNIADPGRDMEDLVVRRAEVFREKQEIDLRTGHAVTALDPGSHTVSGTRQDGSPFAVTYDKLLIATGASAAVPDLPGFDLPGVVALKSLDQGRTIKTMVAGGGVKRAVIVGMGYIALEMCEALRSLGIGVDMVKPRPALLPWMAPELSQVVRAELAAHDVGVFDGCAIRRIDGTAGNLTVVCEGRDLGADMVLVAVGIVPNTGFAAEAGLQCGSQRELVTDRSLCTSHPDIYAAGDCADAYHMVTGEKTWIPLALRANRAGWAVADQVCGRDTRLDGVVGTAVFRVFDLEVAKTGLDADAAEAAGFEPAAVTIQSRSRGHAFPGNCPIHVHMVGDRASGRLLGAQMVGTDGCAHRINAAAVALHGRMTVADFAQTDLAYAPPFGPTWDPLLTAANQLMKKL